MLTAAFCASGIVACQQILGITDPLPLDGGTSGGGVGGTNVAGTGAVSGNAGGGAVSGGAGTGGSGGLPVTQGPLTGIWYSTEYANKGHYEWTQSYAPSGSFYGTCDFDGDGLLDGFVRNGTNWSVMISHGTQFPAVWGLMSFGLDTDVPLLGDVNGDQRCDLVLFTPSEGKWVVAQSAATSVGTAQQYLTSFGVSPDNQFLADVNCDGRADAVAFYSATGRWEVAVANTALNQFDSAGIWADGFGAGSSAQLVGDVTGDGCADFVAFTKSSGEWRVAKSTGSGTSTGTVWLTGFGMTATREMLGDVTGDGRADAVTFSNSGGIWDVAPAKASNDGFDSPYTLASEHGSGSATTLLGNVSGAPSDQLIAVGPDGSWLVLPSTFQRPAAFNTWEARDIRYRPLDGKNVPTQYDSNDASTITYHLDQLTAANIDFVVIDLTRYPVTQSAYSKNAALSVCAAISNAVRNQLPTPRFAVAVGAVRETHDPQTIEDEADAVWEQFVTSDLCGNGDAYFELEGKPLLVLAAEFSDRTAWADWSGDKSATSRFTLRWAQSQMPGTGSNAVPPASYGEYFGFAYPSGPLENAETMVVAPGYGAGTGLFVARNPGGVAAGTYASAWASALTRDPRVVIIDSYNDYMRETAVAPTDTTDVAAPTEQWLDDGSNLAPNLYWDLTRAQNALRKP